MNGVFIISLDFELLWGVKDLAICEDYKKNVLGGRVAIPHILEVFEKYDIHATWATVGIMLNQSKQELIDNIPTNRPQYDNIMCSAYSHLDEVGNSEIQDKYHYANELLLQILKTKNQEVGSHTYSHYYCLEKGADRESFQDDISKSINILGEKYGIKVQSIVFPRNQFLKENINYIKEKGIICYRGNPKRGYKNYDNFLKKFFQKIIRFADAYIPILGPMTYEHEFTEKPVNVCASRFLRPYSSVAVLEKMKVQRIKRQMRDAAKNKKMFHLWWHPHNFGINQDKMLNELDDILAYFKELESNYGMRSMSMGEYATELENDRKGTKGK